jgi:hypothetical protein
MISFLGIFLALNAMAAECFLYKLQGEVEEKQGLYLVVNKDTNSQRELRVSEAIEYLINPYLQKTISGKFVLNGTTIVKSDKVSLTMPDPLNRHEEMVRLSTVPCPQGKKKEAPVSASQKKK